MTEKPHEPLEYPPHLTHANNPPHASSKSLQTHDVCRKEAEITRLEEKVKTLFSEYQKLNETLNLINKTQIELLTQITNLNSIIDTLKWTLTVMIAVFGGLFVFILSEVIKIIH